MNWRQLFKESIIDESRKFLVSNEEYDLTVSKEEIVATFETDEKIYVRIGYKDNAINMMHCSYCCEEKERQCIHMTD